MLGNRSTAHAVAETIRTLIAQGELKAGDVLKQDVLAAKYGISRIPLREALLILEADGLVQLHLNRSAVVTGLTTAEAREIYIMRQALETAALRHALPKLTAAELARAGGVLDEIDHVTDPLRWSVLNWEFHATLYAPCGMPRLIAEMKKLHTNVARYFMVLEEVQYRARSQRDHRDLLRACKAGNIERALGLLTNQLQLSQNTLARYLSKQEAGHDNNDN